MIAIDTARLRLRPFRRDDRDWFAALHADPLVMHDYGAPLAPDASEAKLHRYMASARYGASGRLAVEMRDGEPIGYTGVMAGPAGHPLGPHLQIGWRFCPAVWGHGFATEAASAALGLQFRHAADREVLAYTAGDNFRSQRVMAKLGLRRDLTKDHIGSYGGEETGRGLTWVADPSMAPRWT